MTHIPRPERSALEQTPHSVLVEMVLQQQQVIEGFTQEVERLKAIVERDSRTSSKPPSSDLLRRSEQPKKEETAAEGESQGDVSPTAKRKRGGQPGHVGKTRKGFARVDRYEVVEPQVCPHCGGSHIETAGRSYRLYQVAQLVEHPIEVVEYQQWRGHCGRCGEQVEAPLPADVVAGQDLGVSLQAMLVWLGHYGHLSDGKQQEWLREIGGIDVGVGTLQATTQRVAEAVAPAVEALQQWVKTQPQVQVDETP